MGIGYLSSCSAVHWLLVVTDEPSIKWMSYAFWAESQKQKTKKSTKSNMHGQQQNQSNFRCAVGPQGYSQNDACPQSIYPAVTDTVEDRLFSKLKERNTEKCST